MYKITITLLWLLTTTLNTYAQKELPLKIEKKIEGIENKIKEFDAAGVKTILKPSTKNIISVAVYFKGGLSNQTSDNIGIENLALQWLTADGTATINKDDFTTTADKIGTRISVNSTTDFSSINMTCLQENWEQSWKMLCELILQPAQSETTFEITKQQVMAGIENGESDPDSRIGEMVNNLVYAGTPYANSPEGTKASVEKLTSDQVRTYYISLKNKANMFAVIVGNITEIEAKNKISQLGALPTSKLLQPKFKKIKIEKMGLDIEERELATNYMMGIINAPEFNNPDATALRMAFTILGDRLFNEIRTKRNLSYAPAAGFSRSRFNNPTAFIYVSSTDPTQCAQVMLEVLNKLRTVGFTEKELLDNKETFLTSYFMNLETNNSQNNLLGSYNVMSHWSNSTKYMQDVKALKLADINAAFRKYVTNVHWVYLGDKSKVDAAVFLKPLK